MGSLDGRNRVWRGGTLRFSDSGVAILKEEADRLRESARASPPGVEGLDTMWEAWRYWTILRTLPGFDDLVMMVVTPAEVPSLAAIILVLMPPVPNADPALDTTHR